MKNTRNLVMCFLLFVLLSNNIIAQPIITFTEKHELFNINKKLNSYIYSAVFIWSDSYVCVIEYALLKDTSITFNSDCKIYLNFESNINSLELYKYKEWNIKLNNNEYYSLILPYSICIYALEINSLKNDARIYNLINKWFFVDPQDDKYSDLIRDFPDIIFNKYLLFEKNTSNITDWVLFDTINTYEKRQEERDAEGKMRRSGWAEQKTLDDPIPDRYLYRNEWSKKENFSNSIPFLISNINKRYDVCQKFKNYRIECFFVLCQNRGSSTYGNISSDFIIPGICFGVLLGGDDTINNMKLMDYLEFHCKTF